MDMLDLITREKPAKTEHKSQQAQTSTTKLKSRHWGTKMRYGKADPVGKGKPMVG
jgi:hypothetical protein